VEAIFANPQRRVGIADPTPAFQYSSPKGGIADYSGSNGLMSPSNLSPVFPRDRRGAANARMWNLTQAIFAFPLRGWLNATKYEPRLCSFSDARTSDT
jgi:hypothetical protein